MGRGARRAGRPRARVTDARRLGDGAHVRPSRTIGNRGVLATSNDIKRYQATPSGNGGHGVARQGLA
ncbi:hypothetical protein WS62_11770 [Burkholderia sp. ABCPW 14]|nr:hypothetical protein WS62_11770 [Burkholderia sp. ABCPW 14]